ncbi:MAG: Prolipoprotein diacylglyceryl transferase [Phycisphaerae bacterium]|nr:Prolipoprotein diacylglyceryl transferase [Phycisphaerae bacterium]
MALALFYLLSMTTGAKLLYDLQADRNAITISRYFTPRHYMNGGYWGGALAYLAIVTGVALFYRGRRGEFLDLVVWPLPLSLAAAKLGCLANGCCYGVTCPWPWAITYPAGSDAPAGLPLHPTPLYEIMGLLITLLVMLYINSARWHGTLLWWFLLFYGAVRAVSEEWRGDLADRPKIGPVSTSQIICLSVALISAVLLIIIQHTRNNLTSMTAEPGNLSQSQT